MDERDLDAIILAIATGTQVPPRLLTATQARNFETDMDAFFEEHQRSFAGFAQRQAAGLYKDARDAMRRARYWSHMQCSGPVAPDSYAVVNEERARAMAHAAQIMAASWSSCARMRSGIDPKPENI